MPHNPYIVENPDRIYRDDSADQGLPYTIAVCLPLAVIEGERYDPSLIRPKNHLLPNPSQSQPQSYDNQKIAMRIYSAEDYLELDTDAQIKMKTATLKGNGNLKKEKNVFLVELSISREASVKVYSQPAADISPSLQGTHYLQREILGFNVNFSLYVSTEEIKTKAELEAEISTVMTGKVKSTSKTKVIIHDSNFSTYPANIPGLPTLGDITLENLREKRQALETIKIPETFTLPSIRGVYVRYAGLLLRDRCWALSRLVSRKILIFAGLYEEFYGSKYGVLSKEISDELNSIYERLDANADKDAPDLAEFTEDQLAVSKQQELLYGQMKSVDEKKLVSTKDWGSVRYIDSQHKLSSRAFTASADILSNLLELRSTNTSWASKAFLHFFVSFPYWLGFNFPHQARFAGLKFAADRSEEFLINFRKPDSKESKVIEYDDQVQYSCSYGLDLEHTLSEPGFSGLTVRYFSGHPASHDCYISESEGVSFAMSENGNQDIYLLTNGTRGTPTMDNPCVLFKFTRNCSAPASIERPSVEKVKHQLSKYGSLFTRLSMPPSSTPVLVPAPTS